MAALGAWCSYRTGDVAKSLARDDRELREAQARFQIAFDHAPIGMALSDGEGRWLEVNDALSLITGYSRDELKAATLRTMTHPDDVVLDIHRERDLLAGKILGYQIEKRYCHARGHYIWMQVTVSLVRDGKGRPLYVISMVQDISKQKELAEHLEYLVDHDFLTGLFNRRRFEQELTKEAQRIARYAFSGALVLIDLDRFKDVNDALGHKAGDDLLKGVADALRRRIRRTDVLARVGGDEFAVLLPQTGVEQAETVAEGMVETLRQRVEVEGERSISVTASVGVALFGSFTTTELMANADAAMYQAKATGRDRYATYAPVPDRTVRASAGAGGASGGNSRQPRTLTDALRRG